MEISDSRGLGEKNNKYLSGIIEKCCPGRSQTVVGWEGHVNEHLGKRLEILQMVNSTINT